MLDEQKTSNHPCPRVLGFVNGNSDQQEEQKIEIKEFCEHRKWCSPNDEIECFSDWEELQKESEKESEKEFGIVFTHIKVFSNDPAVIANKLCILSGHCNDICSIDKNQDEMLSKLRTKTTRPTQVRMEAQLEIDCRNILDEEALKNKT